MILLRQFWRWLTGQPTAPVRLTMKLEDEDGVAPLLRHPEQYADLREEGALSVEAFREDRALSEDQALRFARWLYEKDGFLSNATAAAYYIEADGEPVSPTEVPPGATITKMNIRCFIPPSQADELEN